VLLAAFPYLEVGVTLLDGESCEQEAKPVVSFLVGGGKVRVVDPAVEDVHAGFVKPVPSGIDNFLAHRGNPSREQGIPDQWIVEMGRKLRGE
jgi:hypothetical protein